MARRTKQDALATRGSILDAAEMLFSQQGVSRTTLQHIATAAGDTRGAIYWHFDDKAALFNAMMERVTMPLETAMQALDPDDTLDPIGDLRGWMLSVFRITATDPKTRRVFEIATHKIEYVEELAGVRERHLASHAKWMARATSGLTTAKRRGLLKPDLNPYIVALEMWAITDGVVRIWLLDPKAFDLLKIGEQMIDAHFTALAAS
jgi:TetR/AcrR family acrAB operon transcriptional repressor